MSRSVENSSSPENTATLEPPSIHQPKARAIYVHLVHNAARRIPDSFVKQFDIISRRADIFQQSRPALDGLDVLLRYPAKLLGLAFPRSRIDLGISDGHVQLQDVVRDPTIPLL